LYYLGDDIMTEKQLEKVVNKYEKLADGFVDGRQKHSLRFKL